MPPEGLSTAGEVSHGLTGLDQSLACFPSVTTCSLLKQDLTMNDRNSVPARLSDRELDDVSGGFSFGEFVKGMSAAVEAIFEWGATAVKSLAEALPFLTNPVPMGPGPMLPPQ
jgi:hypothetical protein